MSDKFKLWRDTNAMLNGAILGCFQFKQSKDKFREIFFGLHFQFLFTSIGKRITVPPMTYQCQKHQNKKRRLEECFEYSLIVFSNPLRFQMIVVTL